ncbi:hypothetical protein cyc_01471 [Cyclospora cayetanensis]|uniref:Uncharacterized protein n=1 Tax=Cyclospora cayetanensis TaxID=88456 RepID=A0A1D3CUI1_9EIME|nr:hypothetical protein cyc_01471 [Cyclospora cayetanensis]
MAEAESNRLCADGAHLLMQVCIGDVQEVGDASHVRRLRQDDAELAGSLRGSGSTLRVLQSALVFSCRIACAQSNNINSDNRIAYVSTGYADLVLCNMQSESRPCADGAHLLMPVSLCDVQLVRFAGHVRRFVSRQLLCAPVAVRCVCFNVRWCRRVVLHVLKATMSIAAIETLMLCADGAHLLMPVWVGDVQEVGYASHVRYGCDSGRTMLSWQVMWMTVRERVLWLNLRWCRRVVLHVLKATISIAAIASVMLCADGAHLLMPVCDGDVQQVGYASKVRLVNICTLHDSGSELFASKVSIALAKAESDRWSSVWHPCLGDPKHLRVPVGGSGRTMLSRQLVCLPVALRLLCFNLRWCRLVVLHVPKATISIGAIASLMLCADGAHLLMPLSLCDVQDDAELVGSLHASGSTVAVHKSALVSSCRIVCAQSNNVNSGNRSAHEVGCASHVRFGCGGGYVANVSLCADGEHLLMPVSFCDVQEVGCASHVRYGTMLSWQVLCAPVAVGLLCFNLRWCRLVVLHVPKATISIARIEPLMLCAAGAHLLMPISFCDAQLVRCASHVRTMLSSPVEVNGSTVAVLQCALVSSCRIAYAQSNNLNKVSRIAYVRMGCAEFVLCKTLCADGTHLLMPACVGDVQQVRSASHVQFGCGGGYAANVSLCAAGAHLLMPVCVGDVQKDDAELAGSPCANGSTVAVHKSALVSSCRVTCAQSNNINRSNSIAYVNLALAELVLCIVDSSVIIVEPSGILVQ